MLIRKATRVVRDFTCDSRRWAAYQPREGDVIIATAPKVGTTWMQQIVSQLIFQSPELRPLGETSPWIDCRVLGPVEQMLDSIEAQTHRRFLKSHLPLDTLLVYDELSNTSTLRATAGTPYVAHESLLQLESASPRRFRQDRTVRRDHKPAFSSHPED